MKKICFVPVMSILLTIAVAGCAKTSSVSGSTTTCESWSAAQDGVGAPSVVGSTSTQRANLYAAGGGIKTVNNQYYVTYFPSTFTAASVQRVIVSLHGTGGAAENEWNDFKDEVVSRGFGFLALNYLTTSSGLYDDDSTIYTNLKTMISDVSSNCMLSGAKYYLIGFSRGSAKSFSVAYLDNNDQHLFTAIGSISGGAYFKPPTEKSAIIQSIIDGHVVSAYTNLKFWMYCGLMDTSSTPTGYVQCDDMVESQSFVSSYGGTTLELYQDPTGVHGSFSHNATAVDHMFDYFQSLSGLMLTPRSSLE